MLNWKSEYVALLSRYYRENVLGVATTEGYLEANRVIGRAAHVRGSTVGGWIEGIGRPNRAQGERLVRWAATVGWWEWDDNMPARLWVTIAEKLSALIRESKKCAKKGG